MQPRPHTKTAGALRKWNEFLGRLFCTEILSWLQFPAPCAPWQWLLSLKIISFGTVCLFWVTYLREWPGNGRGKSRFKSGLLHGSCRAADYFHLHTTTFLKGFVITALPKMLSTFSQIHYLKIMFFSMKSECFKTTWRSLQFVNKSLFEQVRQLIIDRLQPFIFLHPCVFTFFRTHHHHHHP